MNQAIQNAYPDFEPGLIKTIEEHAAVKHFQTGDVIIRTGQYIKHHVGSKR